METKRKHLPKGFLSSHGEPTFRAIEMFYHYIISLPKGWNKKYVNLEAVKCVQKHFGVDYGFGVMIQWGIQHGCCNSKTSSDRHEAMSKAYVLAQSLINSGIVYHSKGRSVVVRAA